MSDILEGVFQHPPERAICVNDKYAALALVALTLQTNYPGLLPIKV
jgi:hypothetical protein